MYNNFVPPGILAMVKGEPSDFHTVARVAYRPSDLYWTYQNYLIECRNGNRIHCDDFYERELRFERILRARRLMAQCVLIALLYPNASWNEYLPEE